MAGQGSLMFGWSLTDVSVLGSEVFGKALMDSCDIIAYSRIYIILYITVFRYNALYTWSRTLTLNGSSTVTILEVITIQAAFNLIEISNCITM